VEGTIANASPRVRPWRRDGDSLVRELTFRDFDGAMGFVERVAREAVDFERRPDMCIEQFNHVALTIRNLNRAGITEAERRLVDRVDAIVGAYGSG
jgi:pterin-4a-carbinolamine dehydratase